MFTDKTRDSAALLAAAFLGATAFLIYCGWWTLIPDNIAWLTVGDRAMHQLGWMFFRDAPWGIPPGSSPRLGIELANSIALVDGLPLLALPFKLVSPLLPHPFQYWGYWFLLSFSLQGVFAYRIAREFEAGRAMALVAAAFVLITPAFLFRVPLHMALSSHWVILAALFLYARRTPPSLWMWPLLLGLTATIHATLLAMVAVIWFAALVQRLWLGRTKRLRLVAEPAIAIPAVLALLWGVGFFGVHSYGAYGYGSYKLNLLWPLISYDWSGLFPNLPSGRFDYEGLSFLGIGTMGMLILAVLSGAIIQLRSMVSRTWLPLTILMLALMLFAFSKSLSFLDRDIYKIQMPGVIEALGSAFRSTGRFVWPLLYLITIGGVVLVARRFRLIVALPIGLALIAVQGADSYAKWAEFRQTMPAPAPVWSTPLKSPLWDRAAEAGYNRLRTLPLQHGFGSDWRPLGYFALTHGMDTDTVYLARADNDKLGALRARGADILATGDFEPMTIYVLNVLSALRTAPHVKPEDFLGTVDGRILFLRGGAALAEGIDYQPVTHAD